MAQYEASLDPARRTGIRCRQAWSLGLGGWGLLAGDRSVEADRWLDECLELVDALRWTAFGPWPCALSGEARLRQMVGPTTVLSELESAFALSCQLGDPCWEAAVARALGLSCEVMGDLDRAMEWFAEARRRCVRETDSYAALRVEIVVDQAWIGARLSQSAQSNAWTREALSLAARAHMDAHVDRAVELLRGRAPV